MFLSTGQYVFASFVADGGVGGGVDDAGDVILAVDVVVMMLIV